MPVLFTQAAALGSGALVRLVLGLVGGGGSILAVPLLVYGVGIASPHVAIGNVKWRCGLVFAAAGVVGALTGAGSRRASTASNCSPCLAC